MHRVSILVVVDDGRRLGSERRTDVTEHSFQSLLLWMTVVHNRCQGQERRAGPVSILVVVDDGRRPGTGALTRCRLHGFQSLLLWMTVVDGPARRVRARAVPVSILVVVDDGRRQRGDRARLPRLKCFNPCCCG